MVVATGRTGHDYEVQAHRDAAHAYRKRRHWLTHRPEIVMSHAIVFVIRMGTGKKDNTTLNGVM